MPSENKIMRPNWPPLPADAVAALEAGWKYQRDRADQLETDLAEIRRNCAEYENNICDVLGKPLGYTAHRDKAGKKENS